MCRVSHFTWLVCLNTLDSPSSQWREIGTFRTHYIESENLIVCLHTLQWDESHHRNAVSLFNYEAGSCFEVVICKLNINTRSENFPQGVKHCELRWGGCWECPSALVKMAYNAQGLEAANLTVSPAPWQHEGLGPIFHPPCWNCFRASLYCLSATCKADWGRRKYFEQIETLAKFKHFRVCVSWGYLKISVMWFVFKILVKSLRVFCRTEILAVGHLC